MSNLDYRPGGSKYNTVSSTTHSIYDTLTSETLNEITIKGKYIGNGIYDVNGEYYLIKEDNGFYSVKQISKTEKKELIDRKQNTNYDNTPYESTEQYKKELKNVVLNEGTQLKDHIWVFNNKEYYYDDGYLVEVGSSIAKTNNEQFGDLTVDAKTWDTLVQNDFNLESINNNEDNNEETKKFHNFEDSPYYQDGMAIFEETVNKIDQKFNHSRAVYTMYMKFYIGNTVLIDTTSDDWLENCFIDFTHNMNGSGAANQFTLTVLFKPNDRGLQSAFDFESKLSIGSMSYINEEGRIRDVKEMVGQCNFQYGYGDCDIKSAIYEGAITDYDSKMENGNIRFTIKGYSSVVMALERKLSTKPEYIKDCDENTPFKFLENIVETEFKDIYKIKYCEGVKDSDPHCATKDFMHIPQKTFFQVISDVLNSTLSKQDNPSEAQINDEDIINNVTGEGSLDALDKSIQDEYALLNCEPLEKQLYTYFIDDRESELKKEGVSGGIIWIALMPKSTSTDVPYKKPNITFNWFAPQNDGINHIVKDWNPQYKGSVLLALAYISNRETIHEYLTMDKDGNLKQTTSIGASRVGLLENETGEKILNIAQEYSNWSRATQYPYKANMTLIGIPCEIPLLGVIHINAVFVGGGTEGTKKHHSSGDYMVLKKTDKISSSGFWTSLELFKTGIKLPKVLPKQLYEFRQDEIEKALNDIIEQIDNGNIPDGVSDAYRYPGEREAHHVYSIALDVDHNGTIEGYYQYTVYDNSNVKYKPKKMDQKDFEKEKETNEKASNNEIKQKQIKDIVRNANGDKNEGIPMYGSNELNATCGLKLNSGDIDLIIKNESKFQGSAFRSIAATEYNLDGNALIETDESYKMAQRQYVTDHYRKDKNGVIYYSSKVINGEAAKDVHVSDFVKLNTIYLVSSTSDEELEANYLKEF